MRALTALAQPILLTLEPERAHGLAIRSLRTGLYPRAVTAPGFPLRTRCFGLTFPNPLGMAAGFDKNAEVPDALIDAGFGFAEVGTVTPRPQMGNPRPRVFRLMQDRAVINRLGFNNEGHEPVHRRLRRYTRNTAAKRIIGVNIGANKDSEDRIADYVLGIIRFADVASYLTINISSPNTPGLRALQGGEDLERLLSEAVTARDKAAQHRGHPIPLLLKIAPDLDGEGLQAVCAGVERCGIDGMIVSNTTLSRQGLRGRKMAEEEGGLSGAPLFERSTIMLARTYQLTGGRVPLIGVGGISSGADAWTKIRAGASLIQLYTGLIYGGFGLVEDILETLRSSLSSEGFGTIADAVGQDAGTWAARTAEPA